MPPKRQLAYLKEARTLAMLRKIEAKNDTLVNNESFLFKDRSTEDLCGSENNTSYHKDFEWEGDDEFEDDVEMTDDDEDILDMDAFTKLLRAGQDSSNFESHKIPFLRSPHLST